MFSHPTGAIYLAGELQTLAETDIYDLSVIRPRGLIGNAQSYLEHVGFWRYMQNWENEGIGAAKANSNYLPITKIQFEETDIKKFLRFRAVQRKIQEESRNIARVISNSRENNDGQNRTLSYSLREIIRNVLEHGEKDHCIVFGQKWGHGITEIVIADRGIGIASSLQHAFDIENERQALELAIQPGVSSKLAPSDSEDEWDNDGFGLYFLSNFGNRFGKFLLMSGEAALVVDKNGNNFSTIPKLTGTLIGMRLRQISNEEFIRAQEEILNDGRNMLEEALVSRNQISKSTSPD
jgi:hypothetical protein